MIDLELFMQILGIESTSGSEKELAGFLAGRLEAGDVRPYDVGDGTLNLLFSWGEPKTVFCTHMDTYKKVYGKPAPKSRGRIHPTALASRRGGGVLLRNDKEKAAAKRQLFLPILSYLQDHHLISIFFASFSGSASLFGKVTSRIPSL